MSPAARQTNVLGTIVIALMVALPLPACIAIPYADSEPLPGNAILEVPEDIRSDPSQVLVLAQSSIETGTTSATERTKSTVVVPIFVKGTELASLSEIINVGAVQELVLVSGGAAGVGPLYHSRRRERLTQLCVLAADGRWIDLDFSAWGSIRIGDAAQIYSTKGVMTLSRRDAILSVLNSATNAFENDNGPCGISGQVDWLPAMRTRTIEFISSMNCTIESIQ